MLDLLEKQSPKYMQNVINILLLSRILQLDFRMTAKFEQIVKHLTILSLLIVIYRYLSLLMDILFFDCPKIVVLISFVPFTSLHC